MAKVIIYCQPKNSIIQKIITEKILDFLGAKWFWPLLRPVLIEFSSKKVSKKICFVFSEEEIKKISRQLFVFYQEINKLADELIKILSREEVEVPEFGRREVHLVRY